VLTLTDLILLVAAIILPFGAVNLAWLVMVERRSMMAANAIGYAQADLAAARIEIAELSSDVSRLAIAVAGITDDDDGDGDGGPDRGEGVAVGAPAPVPDADAGKVMRLHSRATGLQAASAERIRTRPGHGD
jgi:hypothetical protein